MNKELTKGDVTIKPRSKEFYEKLEQFLQSPNSRYKPKEKLIDDDFNEMEQTIPHSSLGWGIVCSISLKQSILLAI